MPKAQNLQKCWDNLNDLFEQWKLKKKSKQIVSLTYSWRFLRYERLKKKLGFRNLQEKLEKIW